MKKKESDCMNTFKTIAKVTGGVTGFMFLILIIICGVPVLSALMIVALPVLLILFLIGLPALLIGGLLFMGKCETDYRAEIVARGIERAEARKNK
jgi:uncharacterized membrane protein